MDWLGYIRMQQRLAKLTGGMGDRRKRRLTWRTTPSVRCQHRESRSLPAIDAREPVLLPYMHRCPLAEGHSGVHA